MSPTTASQQYVTSPAPVTLITPVSVTTATTMANATSPVSVYQEAALGANNPEQSTSTQQGFYEAPNALFRAMNQQSLTDIKTLTSGSVGTYLQSKKILNGDMATIVNATLNFASNKSKNLKDLSPNIKTSSARKNFIPIIIKTEFNYNTVGMNNSEGDSVSVPTPLYIIFDSTPEQISFAKGANWQAKEFLGRPEPVWTYSSSTATTFSLVGKFYAESFQAHGKLLKLSDYIMSLVTPSEKNYMPSPVTVFIGEWKKLRCIVTQITIDFTGPWSIQVTSDDQKNTNSLAEKSIISNALTNQSSGEIPSHAPYYFEATFNFTMVGQDNNVQYAEQVVSGSQGFSNSSDTLTAGDAQKSALNNAVYSLFPTYSDKTINTGLYTVQSSTKYTFTNGRLTTAIDNTTNYTPAALNMNLYANANAVNRLSDQGIISNALNSQMLSLFQKANPTSTNTPQTTTSLNPFKKLF